MKLLVGLGNPGTKYKRHRHNIGFMAVEAIARAHGFEPWRKRFQAETAEGRIEGEPCLILKPTTFMNQSGQAVSQALNFYKLGLSDLYVFHDELDLAPGKVRVKNGGGHAGHNGLRSIDAHIGPGFNRVRIGIGHPGRKDLVHGYVLHDFAKADRAWVEPLLDAIAAAAPYLAKGDDGRFMNQVSLAMQNGAATEARQAKPAKTGRRGKRSDAPSQRDLARRAAEKDEARPREGGLTSLLRRWMGRKSS